MDNTWEYCQFASCIAPQAMRLNTHGFTITRTKEWGYVLFHVVGTNITVGTWTPIGNVTEEEAYALCMERLLQQLNRSEKEEAAENSAIEAADRHYQAQYAYACGYYD